MAQARLYVEVEPGPVMRAGLDVTELATDMLELIPEGHETERAELESRCRGLMEMLQNGCVIQVRSEPEPLTSTWPEPEEGEYEGGR